MDDNKLGGYAHAPGVDFVYNVPEKLAPDLKYTESKKKELLYKWFAAHFRVVSRNKLGVAAFGYKQGLGYKYGDLKGIKANVEVLKAKPLKNFNDNDFEFLDKVLKPKISTILQNLDFLGYRDDSRKVL